MAKGIEGQGKKQGTLSWTTGLWGKQALLVSRVGAVSVPSLSSPWHRAWTQQVHRVRVTGAWALFLQGHWFRGTGPAWVVGSGRNVVDLLPRQHPPVLPAVSPQECRPVGVGEAGPHF